ncbi:TetR/AcrR family transcriptional regulator [Halanaerobaculum tunisiense]
MPKIIENVEEKIFYTVIELVKQNGLKNTSMKMIAENTDIAVGTLYNYFSNKEELISYVISKSWKNTFRKLDQILEEDSANNKKVEKFVITLYEEISKRKAIGNKLIKNNIIAEERFEKIKSKLQMKFMTLFDILDLGKNQFFSYRLVDTIIVTIINLSSAYNDYHDENVTFLKKLLSNLLY